MKQGGRIFTWVQVPVGAWECWTLPKSLLLSECPYLDYRIDSRWGYGPAQSGRRCRGRYEPRMGRAYEISYQSKDTVIGIAASGTTPYVIGALREARKHGILTGCITSNPNSPMAAEADVAIEMIVGPEYVTGSSRMKSGTGQKMILNMISTSVMIQLGRVKGNKMVNMQLSNHKLVERGTRMIMEELGLDHDHAQNCCCYTVL